MSYNTKLWSLLPPVNKFNFELSRGLKITLVINLVFIYVNVPSNENYQGEITQQGTEIPQTKTSETTQPTSVLETTSNLYVNNVYGFQIEYPETWEIKESVNVEGFTAIVAFMDLLK